MSIFKLVSGFEPQGDQPRAIQTLCENLRANHLHHVLLGVTGSGKTFTMAHVIAALDKPALIIAPNKTLAAQLYNEFKMFFPDHAVEYFVSYYDYYQPEAYIPSSDTYIQKDASINEMIDKLRHSATRSVLSRRDVIVVASVSCIFGLGAPEDYLAMRLEIQSGDALGRDRLLSDLITMHYERNDIDFHRGVFRVRGDRVEIFPAYEEKRALRIDFFGDTIERVALIDALRGSLVKPLERMTLFPASHYVTSKATLNQATAAVTQELKRRIKDLRSANKLIEAQRIEERTHFDLEMMMELGYCNGIENYSRHLTGRTAGEPPPTLLDYFPSDFLLFIDESHITVPQLRAMYRGDRSRKETLVEYGFRLPSALDNRPLRFSEFEARIEQVVYVSATPGDFEAQRGQTTQVQQIVRPTGLIDPVIVVRPAENQVDDLLEEIRKREACHERVLVTTLTKRLSEDLTEYYTDLGVKVRYLHSDISTLERMDIIRDLRTGHFDVLIGINLLREGLDIPEVSLIGILDADKQGFLRSARSLIQTCGRAARNVNGTVIMYADTVTPAMQQALDETNRRRTIQKAYNRRHKITPATIEKEINTIFETVYEADYIELPQAAEASRAYGSIEELEQIIAGLEREMFAAAKDLAFEEAALLRDKIDGLKKKIVFEIG